VADDPPKTGAALQREPRYRVNEPCTFVRGVVRCDAMVLDLSNEGLLVELKPEFAETEAAEGELVRIEFTFRDEPMIRLPAVITRRIKRKLGLLLFGVSGDPQNVWRALVARIARTHPAPDPAKR
jgi:hypothetical protein